MIIQPFINLIILSFVQLTNFTEHTLYLEANSDSDSQEIPHL
jgi:hypothetical protein